MSWILKIIGVAFFVIGITVSIKDINEPERPWNVIGEVWFEYAPTSLQMTETVISRYIDPCSLLGALECEPFIWHPAISTMLEWYATPSFIVFGLILIIIGRWLGLRRNRR